MGIQPDLTEGLSEKDLAKLEQEKLKVGKAKSQIKELENVNDIFEEFPQYKPTKKPSGYAPDKINNQFNKKFLLGSD